MKRPRSVLVRVCLCLAVFLAGCVTPRDQVAVVRGYKFASHVAALAHERFLNAPEEEKDIWKGEEILALEVSGELGQVALDLGAVKLAPDGKAVVPGAVDPEKVLVTAAAAHENAQGIAQDRASRSWLAGVASGVLDWAGAHWPPLGAAIGLAGAIAALWKKLKGAGAALGSAQTTVTAGVTLIQRAKEALADGKLTLADFKAIFAQAGEAGPAFIDGAAGLKAEYDRLKAEWAADGTPIRSAPANPAAN